MGQIAVDSKGNKIRWDETKQDWVPVEKAVNDKGITIEYDGTKWNPIYGPKKEPPISVSKISVGKKPGFWSIAGEALKETGKDIIAPIEGAVRTAASIPAYLAGLATTIGAQGLTGDWEKGAATGGKVTDFLMGGGARLGGEKTANMERILSPIAAPFSVATETIPQALAPDEPKTQAMLSAGIGLLLVSAPKLGIDAKTLIKDAKRIVWRNGSIPSQSKSAMMSGLNKAEASGAKTVADVMPKRPLIGEGPVLDGIMHNNGLIQLQFEPGTAISVTELKNFFESSTPGASVDVIRVKDQLNLRNNNKFMATVFDKKNGNISSSLGQKIVDAIGGNKGFTAFTRGESARLQSPPVPTGNPIADAAALEAFNAAQKSSVAARPSPAGIPKQNIPPVKPTDINPINARPQDILVAALKQSKRVLPAQKASYARETGEKLSKAEEAGQAVRGEAGVRASLSQMKGKLRKVDFEIPAIPPETREALFNMVWDHKYLKTGERLSLFGQPETASRSASGLIGMLDYGKFPAKHEVELMNRVFGSQVSDALIGKLSPVEQIKFWATNIANVPRTLMASFDLSAPLRQGVWLIGRPKQFGRAFADMFRSLKSEEGYNATVERMAAKPTFNLGRESGLALTEIGSALNKTEEQFLGSGIIEKAGTAALKKWPGWRGKAINLIPEGVKVSQRAYTGFLNKLRADVFDSMVNDAKGLGLYGNEKTGGADIFSNPKLSGDIARYVNIASGRGSLAGLAKDHAALTNAVFFSPRLMSARFALFDPRTYMAMPKFARGGLEKAGLLEQGSLPKVSKFVRQEAIIDAGKFIAFYTTAAGLAKFVLGQKVGEDPRSSDYGKIISGNTSIDLQGGIGQYFRLAAVLSQPLLKKLGVIQDAYLVSSSSGKETKMGGGFAEKSMLDVLTKFFSQKQNPVSSFFVNILAQSDESGKPINVGKEITERIIPMMMGDTVEAYKDDPNGLKLAIVGLLTLFGAGVTTYPLTGDKSFLEPTDQTRAEKLFRGHKTGDPVIDALAFYEVKATIGQKKLNGQPIPPERVDDLIKRGGPTVRKMVSFYLNNPAFNKATDEQRKKWLQKAVDSAWRMIKAEETLRKK